MIRSAVAKWKYAHQIARVGFARCPKKCQSSYGMVERTGAIRRHYGESGACLASRM